MSAFILRRLLLSIPTLIGVLVVAFLLLFVALANSLPLVLPRGWQ